MGGVVGWREAAEGASGEGLTEWVGVLGVAEWDKLRRYDVVITSYPTCASEYATEPKPKKAKGKGANSGDEGPAKKAGPVKKMGPLFGGEYYRIILDEAHQIKNRSTK